MLMLWFVIEFLLGDQILGLYVVVVNRSLC